MKKKDEYLNKIVKLLRDLKKKYPTMTLSQHIAQATYEYDDIWGLPDKELYYCLERYTEDAEAPGFEYTESPFSDMEELDGAEEEDNEYFN